MRPKLLAAQALCRELGVSVTGYAEGEIYRYLTRRGYGYQRDTRTWAPRPPMLDRTSLVVHKQTPLDKDSAPRYQLEYWAGGVEFRMPITQVDYEAIITSGLSAALPIIGKQVRQ